MNSIKQLFISPDQFWVKVVLFDILLCMSSKLVFSIKRVQEGRLHITKDITLFQYNLKKSLSAVHHPICLSRDVSLIGMAMGIDFEVGDQIKVAFFTFFK